MEMLRKNRLDDAVAPGAALGRLRSAPARSPASRWRRFLPLLEFALFIALFCFLRLEMIEGRISAFTACGALLALVVLFVIGRSAAVQLHESRQVMARLQESERRYRELAEGLSDAVLLIGEDGTCRHVSPAVETLLGFRPDEVEGCRVDARIHPADRETARRACLAVLDGGGESETVELRLRDRAGAWRWLEVRLHLLQEKHSATLACAVRDISERRAREEVLERRASIDALTGLLNRDSLMRELETATQGAEEGGEPLALVLFDIDHFKRINDTHGHPTGDRVIGAIGEACRDIVRTSDTAGRLGGEEFGILLRGAAFAAAADVCMRLRQRIEAQPVLDSSGAPIAVTISAGIASHQEGLPAETLLASADRALYAAKDAGRDRVYAAVGERLIQVL